jgi:hypothetical protein
VLVTENSAVTAQSVFAKGASFRVFAYIIESQCEVGGRTEGVGVIFSECSPAAFKGIFVEFQSATSSPEVQKIDARMLAEIGVST